MGDMAEQPVIRGYSLIFGYGVVLLRSPMGGASVALCSSTPRVLSGVYALLGPPL